MANASNFVGRFWHMTHPCLLGTAASHLSANGENNVFIVFQLPETISFFGRTPLICDVIQKSKKVCHHFFG